MAKRYWGVQIANPFDGLIDESDIERIASWDCNFVSLHFYWFRVEPDKNRPGEYDAANLERLEQLIGWIRKHGMMPLLNGSVSYDPNAPTPGRGWSDGLGVDYVNINVTGRQRYAAMWKMLAQRFPGVMCSPIHFVYHRQPGLSVQQRQTYYTKSQPAFYDAIRSVSNAPIVFNPIHQGIGADLISGEYKYLINNPPPTRVLNDPKVYFDTNNHGKDYARIVRSPCGCWDGDEDHLKEHWQPVLAFKERFGVNLIVLENLSFNMHNKCPARPVAQCRLNFAEATFALMQEHDVSGTYYSYKTCHDGRCQGGYGTSPINKDGTDTPIVALIKKYAPTPTPPPRSPPIALYLECATLGAVTCSATGNPAVAVVGTALALVVPHILWLREDYPWEECPLLYLER